jgi:hypothetical protein
VITLADPGTLGCNPTTAEVAAAFGAATVTDNCSAGLTATFTDGAESVTGCTVSVTRTWSATDDCGNTATATQTVSFTRDTDQPVITLADPGTLGCNPTTAEVAAAFGAATVSDNCTIGLTATFTDGAETVTGCTVSVTRTWAATDDCGNTTTATQTITFTRDTDKPVITLADPGTLGCNPTTAEVAAAFGAAYR